MMIGEGSTAAMLDFTRANVCLYN